jgi:sugar lactone lactonase YvrE
VTHSSPELLVEGLGFPECPRWFDGHLLVADMMTKQISKISLDGDRQVFAELPNRPAGMGVLPDGSLLVASMLDCRLLRFGAGSCTEYADLSSLTRGLLNDVVVDSGGRIYVGDTIGNRNADGTISPEPGEPSTHIHLVGPDGSARTVARDLRVTNGLVVTPDGRTMIVAETFGSKLTAFTIAPDGSLVDRRPFADLPGEVPNGIALDAEGAVWVSSHNGRFLRVFEGGRIADAIDVPGHPGCMAIACILGGPDRRHLFLVSADFGSTRMPTYQDWLDNLLRTGRVDVTEVDVPGAGWP